MTGAEWFVVAILGLEAGASIAYVLQGRFPDALIWVGVALSNAAWVWKLTSGR